MRPKYLTKQLVAADADAIAESQTPGAGGPLILNGVAASGSPAVATLDTPRRVLFTFAADESARTFTVYGRNAVSGGGEISEEVEGTAGTAATTLDFGQITRIEVDAATAGAVEVGTNGVGATPWQLVDYHLDPTNVVIAVDVEGTVNYTVQYTYDNFLGEYDPASIAPLWRNTYPQKIWDDPVLAASAADGQTTYSFPFTGWRVQINSGDGSLRVAGVQAGIGGHVAGS